MDRALFEKRVQGTLRNAAGQRRLTDHLRRLAPEITALRKDGVDWTWIAEALGSVREEPPRCTDHSIRTCWSRLGLSGTTSGQADAQRLVTRSQDMASDQAGNESVAANALSRMHARQSRSNQGLGRRGGERTHE